MENQFKIFCNGIECTPEQLESISIPVSDEQILHDEPKIKAGWGKMSVATASQGDTGFQEQRDTLTIVNGRIEIIFQTTGRAKIVSSMISNSSHNLYLNYGINNVPPGTYTHLVGDGQVQNLVTYPPGSSIKSILYHD
jgi:hypothetical protein